MKFENVTKEELDKMYNKELMSYRKIAKKYGVSPGKVQRQCLKFGFEKRDRADAQKLSLEQNHPTKGRKRTAEEKLKIGQGISKNWSNLTEEELTERKKTHRAAWDRLPESKKKEIHEEANKKIRETIKGGSKLERYIHEQLLRAGYFVHFHSVILVNEKLEVDIYLPKNRIVIEVDGPSHFEPIFGQETLERNQKADQQKDSLVINNGMCIIRVQHQNTVSNIKRIKFWEVLHKCLKKLEQNFPEDPLKRKIVIRQVDREPIVMKD